MSRRVTMKDIAQRAGVSAATVSYVLSYSEKEKISHKTRMRVFEIARQLNYVPNMAAKALTNARIHLVGVMINLEANSQRSKLYAQYDLFNELQQALYLKGYDVVYLPIKQLDRDINVGARRSLDAVFLIDIDDETMETVSKKFYIPAIILDGFIHNTLFCKILTDFDAVIERARILLGGTFYVIMEHYNNRSCYELFAGKLGRENVCIHDSSMNVKSYIAGRRGEAALVIGEILGMQVEQHVPAQTLCVVVSTHKDTMLKPDTKRIVVSNAEKAESAVQVMEKLLRLEQDLEQVTYIRPMETQPLSG